jgi:hypothetical protein
VEIVVDEDVGVVEDVVEALGVTWLRICSGCEVWSLIWSEGAVGFKGRVIWCWMFIFT